MESNQIMEKIQAEFADVECQDHFLLVPVEQLIPVMQQLRERYQFNYLSNETAVDYKDYMEIIYNLSRVPEGDTLTVKTKVTREQPEAPSMVEIWPGALWQEREIYDLLGIVFTNHPDLRRILLEDDFEGYPLRKDFQWVGGRD